jgi:hypothetical protein
VLEQKSVLQFTPLPWSKYGDWETPYRIGLIWSKWDTFIRDCGTYRPYKKVKRNHSVQQPSANRDFRTAVFGFMYPRYLFSLQTEKIVAYVPTNPHLLQTGLVQFYNNILPLTPVSQVASSLGNSVYYLGDGLDDQTSIPGIDRHDSLRDRSCTLSQTVKATGTWNSLLICI